MAPGLLVISDDRLPDRWNCTALYTFQLTQGLPLFSAQADRLLVLGIVDLVPSLLSHDTQYNQIWVARDYPCDANFF